MVLVLQVNDSGAWRNMVRFSDMDLARVQIAASHLARAAVVRGMRIVKTGSYGRPIVMYRCEHPEYRWSRAS